jgi:filamentous hemagglutinin
LAGSLGRGKANGQDLTWDETTINAGREVALTSGSNTQLNGAVVTAPKVSATVGGDLTITSLQDTSTYRNQQQSVGGSITFGPKVTGSVNFANSNIKSDYASVDQQAGVRAGDNGFKVNVQGDTTLTGGAITSTDKAIAQGKNSFTTGGQLTTTDINNQANYQADSVGVNIGVGVSPTGKYVPGGTSAGIGSDSGKSSSITRAGISDIAGDTTARTDTNQANTSVALAKIFDADKVQKEINAQVAITQAFSQVAPKAAENYARNKFEALNNQAKKEQDPEKNSELLDEAAKWRPNGSYNIAMNIIIGAAGGGTVGAAGSITKESISWAADQMRQAMIEDSKKFPGICVNESECISNMSGESIGVNGDNTKIAGGRIVLADWCAADRCTVDSNTISGYKENSNGTVIFNPKDSEGNSIGLNEFLNQNPEWRSELGGHQGSVGQISIMGIQFDYAPNSFWDKLAESYAGTHDKLNSSIWYDKLGNTKNLDDTTLGRVGDITNMTNVLVATPFALSVLLPPQVWNAIFTLIEAKK